MEVRDCITYLMENNQKVVIFEADLTTAEVKTLADRIKKLDLATATKQLERLHKKIADKKASAADGARYHLLKGHVKKLGGKPLKNPFIIRTKSDFAPMKDQDDYTKVPMPKDRLIHSLGNRKLGKDTLVFNMGAAKDCPSRKLGLCKVCIAGARCYALKAEDQYSGDASNSLRKRRLQAQQWQKIPVEQLAGLMAMVIQKHPGINYIRINESGDFYTQKDVEKISDLADLLTGDARVYMYTARRDLDYSNVSDNLVINGSGFMVHNEYRFVPKEEIDNIPEDADVCSGDCPNCDWCKTRNKRVIYDKEH